MTSSGQARAVTEVLQQWRDGDRDAVEKLLPLVYEELRRQARAYLARERRGHTLQPTALVHETYLKLADKLQPQWRDRIHFYAVSSQLMRRILVDHARQHSAEKRGGRLLRVSLDEESARVEARALDLLALDAALERLAEKDPRKARMIEFRFFGGLSLEETAQALGVSIPLVVKEVRLARAWLYRDITSD